MVIVTIGIDLAKSAFVVHGLGESGKPEIVALKFREKTHSTVNR
ncbi:MAG: hypothetical protein ABI845_02840 [Polaromonas sp.]